MKAVSISEAVIVKGCEVNGLWSLHIIWLKYWWRWWSLRTRIEFGLWEQRKEGVRGQPWQTFTFIRFNSISFWKQSKIIRIMIWFHWLMEKSLQQCDPEDESDGNGTLGGETNTQVWNEYMTKSTNWMVTPSGRWWTWPNCQIGEICSQREHLQQANGC